MILYVSKKQRKKKTSIFSAYFMLGKVRNNFMESLH